MKRDLYDEIASNKRRSYALVFFFVLFVGLLGLVFTLTTSFGILGFPIAVAIAGIIAYVQYKNGDKVVLKISKAKPVEKADNPKLFNTVEGVAIAAGVPMPKIYTIEDSSPNAFATGRDPEHASIAVTTGLLDKLNRQELEGVIAHEMSHIRNYDIKMMTIAVALAGVVVMLSDFILRSFIWGGGRRRNSGGKGNLVMFAIAIVLAIIAPIFAMMIQLAISRKREYLADASGAMLTRYPEGLASALEKISKDKEPLEVANKATAHLYIANPVNVKTLFSTHPPIEERITRLRAM
ncbi:MAG: zinc metalloprotease HtpX [archaeon]